MTTTDRVLLKMAVSTGIFDDAIRGAIASLRGLMPLLSRLENDRKRHHVRVVTRRKQRNHW